MSRVLRFVPIAVVAAGVACNQSQNPDKVPVGSQVQVTRQDGALVEGRLVDRTPENVVVDTGRSNRAVERAAIADIRVVDPRQPAPEPPPRARFREYSLHAGTALTIRLDRSLASNASRIGDPVEGTLVEPVVESELDVLPAGSILRGAVSNAEPSGRVKGRARLALRFTRLVVPARGDDYPIAARFDREARATKGEDAEKIGVGAGIGAIVGALVGGGKGAAVGAGVGAGAGTGVVLATTGDEVQLPSGTLLRLTLEEPLTVKVPVRR